MSEPTEAMIDAAMVAFGDTELVGYDFTRRAVTRAVEAALADTRRTSSDEVERLRDAATQLYMAGRWNCDRPVNESSLWGNLRVALGLPVGTATNAGVAAMSVQSDKGEA